MDGKFLICRSPACRPNFNLEYLNKAPRINAHGIAAPFDTGPDLMEYPVILDQGHNTGTPYLRWFRQRLHQRFPAGIMASPLGSDSHRTRFYFRRARIDVFQELHTRIPNKGIQRIGYKSSLPLMPRRWVQDHNEPDEIKYDF